MESFEVEANDASELTSVEENQELRFDSGVEVLLDQGSLVAVDSDVSELLVKSGGVLVILLNLLDDWVPLSGEVEQSEGWSLFVQVSDCFIQIFRSLQKCKFSRLMHWFIREYS